MPFDSITRNRIRSPWVYVLEHLHLSLCPICGRNPASGLINQANPEWHGRCKQDRRATLRLCTSSSLLSGFQCFKPERKCILRDARRSRVG